MAHDDDDVRERNHSS